jgi:hypothetical protein
MRLLVVALLGCVACAAVAKPTELVSLPPVPPPGPWQTLRATLNDCAASSAVGGQMQVRLDLDHYGKVIAVDAEYGDGFTACVGNSLMATRYRRYADRRLLVSFTAM